MNCNCLDENNIIQFIKGTSANISFDFDEDITSYNYAEFGIAKNYGDTPVFSKNSSITDNTVEIELTPDDTDVFTDFLNGKNSSKYFWYLDLIDSDNDVRTNVFPQTGEPAPLCIVYKHV